MSGDTTALEVASVHVAIPLIEEGTGAAILLVAETDARMRALAGRIGLGGEARRTSCVIVCHAIRPFVQAIPSRRDPAGGGGSAGNRGGDPPPAPRA